MKKPIGISVLLKHLSTALMFTLLISATAQAGIYKWTDEEGNIHYSSQRPEDAAVEQVKLHLPPPATPEEEEEEEEDQLSDDDQAQQQRDIYCSNERNRLKTTEANTQIHVKDEKGNVKKLSSSERKQSLDKIKANLKKYCK